MNYYVIDLYMNVMKILCLCINFMSIRYCKWMDVVLLCKWLMIMKCIMIRPVLYDLVYSVYIHYVCHHWLQYMKYILVTFSATILVVWKHQQHIFLEQCQSLWCHSCLPQKFVKNYEMPIVKFVIWNMVRVFLNLPLVDKLTISW